MTQETKVSLSPIPEPEGARPIGGHAHLLDLDEPIESMGRMANELGPVYKLRFPGGAELVLYPVRSS